MATDKNKDDDDDTYDSPFDTEAEAEHLNRIDRLGDDEEIEVDHEDDANLDRPRKGKGDLPDDDDDEEKDEDDDGETNDKNAKRGKDESKVAFQKRIDRLTARAKGAEEELERQRERADNAESEVQVGRRFGVTATLESINARETELEGKLEAAIEAGETKEQVKITKELGKVQAQKLAYENAASRMKPKEGEGGDKGQQQQRQPQQQQRIDPTAVVAREHWKHQEARDWRDQNKGWYEKPENDAERAYLMTINDKLGEEGYVPTEAAWYRELDKRMARKFPNLAKKGDGDSGRGQRQQGRQRVAGADHEPIGGERQNREGRDRMISSEDRRNMIRFKLDPNKAADVKQYRRESRGLK